MSTSQPWLKKNHVNAAQKRQKSFCIFTEGKTEKIYFNDFDLANVEVRCLGGGGVLHLVAEAKIYMKQSKYSGYDYYWLVFDKDNNSAEDIQQAISIAEKCKISWCFSNPCFEIWFLLHFDYFHSPTTPEDLKERLVPKRIPGYTENMRGIFNLLKDKQIVAVNYSKKLWPLDERSSQAKQLRDIYPATNADALVGMLNDCNE